MDKEARQKLIKEIVDRGNIRTQSELVRELRARGHLITQATVSRDIAEIPLQKMRTAGGLVYHWQGKVDEPDRRLSRTIRELVLSLGRSDNLVLVKTEPGQAAPVALCLDELRLDPVLGTIAGDDTVLVVAKNRNSAKMLEELLVSKMG